MTIKFENYSQMKKFFAKGLFCGDCQDNTLPKFSEVKSILQFVEVQVYSAELSVDELRQWLKENKIQYAWVSAN